MGGLRETAHFFLFDGEINFTVVVDEDVDSTINIFMATHKSGDYLSRFGVAQMIVVTLLTVENIPPSISEPTSPEVICMPDPRRKNSIVIDAPADDWVASLHKSTVVLRPYCQHMDGNIFAVQQIPADNSGFEIFINVFHSITSITMLNEVSRSESSFLLH